MAVSPAASTTPVVSKAAKFDNFLEELQDNFENSGHPKDLKELKNTSPVPAAARAGVKKAYTALKNLMVKDAKRDDSEVGSIQVFDFKYGNNSYTALTSNDGNGQYYWFVTSKGKLIDKDYEPMYS